MTSEELMKRTGMEDLSNIVRVRIFTLAGHILWAAIIRQPSKCGLCGYAMGTRGMQEKKMTSKKVYYY